MHENAWLYELENRGFDVDLPFWVSLLDDYQPTCVLDIACGTGRITFPLLTSGRAQDQSFQIVGLDNSPWMLELARERAELLSERDMNAVHFVEGDMRDFDLNQTFDLIVVGFNSLAYIYTLDDHRDCLRSIRRHLAPGGHFAIDLIVPQLSYLAEAQTSVPVMRLELDVTAPEQGVKRLLRFATERFDPISQTDDTTYFYEIYYTDGRQERFTDDLAWHMYFPRELTMLLEDAGFRTVERYGSYQKTSFGPRSMHYLWVMTADNLELKTE
ncbi:MAG: class I SAM-dependent methyltransferase [Chloroflexia bacterium]|nr:class I SAM-dependent methyltransferase [Chloroflexia bacterium]